MTRRGIAPAVLALAGLLLLGSIEANASPVFFLDGTPGTSQADALAAIAGYNPDLDLVDLDTPPPSLSGFVFTGVADSGAGGTDCTTTLDLSCITLRITLPGLVLPASLNDGSVEATSNWTVTNVSDQNLNAANLIFTSTPGAITNDPTLVGLEPDPADDYVIIEMSGLYAAAISLGPLAAGASTTAVVHYRVEDFLEPAGGGNFMLPQLLIEAIVVPVPEPGAFSLFAVGLVGIAASRRRR